MVTLRPAQRGQLGTVAHSALEQQPSPRPPGLPADGTVLRGAVTYARPFAKARLIEQEPHIIAEEVSSAEGHASLAVLFNKGPASVMDQTWHQFGRPAMCRLCRAACCTTRANLRSPPALLHLPTTEVQVRGASLLKMKTELEGVDGSGEALAFLRTFFSPAH